MKNLVVLLLLPFSVFAQKGFVIKGDVKGIKDSTLVFLVSGATGKSVAEDYAKNGKFTLKGHLENADIYQLNFIGYQATPEVFMQNDEVFVNGDVNHLQDLVFSGSPLQNDYVDYLKGFNPLKEKLGKLVSEINAEKPGMKRDSLITSFGVYKNMVISQVDAFIKQKPSSQVSAFVVYAVNPLFSGVDELEAKYNRLGEPAKEGFYGKLIQQTIAAAKVGAVGTKAIDFTQNDTANRPVSLSSYKGKYVLVDFWASWCRPCRMENPNVVAVYNQFKNKNFAIIGVSLDQQKDNWLKAIHDDGLTWTHVSDLQFWNNAVARLYHIESIPDNMLIDPNGVIIARGLRSEQLKEKLAEVLQ